MVVGTRTEDQARLELLRLMTEMLDALPAARCSKPEAWASAELKVQEILHLCFVMQEILHSRNLPTPAEQLALPFPEREV